MTEPAKRKRGRPRKNADPTRRSVTVSGVEVDAWRSARQRALAAGVPMGEFLTRILRTA